MIKFSRSNEKYGCFSNFYPCSVEYGGIVYPNSECAWQSLKTLDMEKRKKFATYKEMCIRDSAEALFCQGQSAMMIAVGNFVPHSTLTSE